MLVSHLCQPKVESYDLSIDDDDKNKLSDSREPTFGALLLENLSANKMSKFFLMISVIVPYSA